MAVLKMEEITTPKEDLTPATTAQAVVSAVAAQRQAVAGLGTIDGVRREIDDVLADMREFYRAEPDQVMAAVSAHSARLTEIVVQIGRIEVVMREWRPVREEADKVLAELKSQFNIASRLIAVRQMDFDLIRGQV